MAPSRPLPAFCPRSPFRRTDFPDARLWRRANRTLRGLLDGLQHGRAQTATWRRGAQRFYGNPRLSGTRLLHRSSRVLEPALLGAPIVLSCEDSMYVRGRSPDAGPLQHGWDRGYLVHLSFATLPGLRRPLAWLGARVWSRKGRFHDQDHKSRPLDERESAKWHEHRTELRHRVLLAGFRGRLISLNDREGDCWNSLSLARKCGHEVVTRATQNRRLLDGRWLRSAVRHGHQAGTLELRVRVRRPDGRSFTRTARVQVRWAEVTLAPPKSDPFVREHEPISLVALQVRERRAPRGVSPVTSWLLTTCAVTTEAEAREVVGWYGSRWSVEIGNDLLKNALEIEDAMGKDLEQFRRALALAGPAAAQLGAWLSLAQAPSPEPAERHLTKRQLQTLEQVAGFEKVRLPPKPWTMKDVVQVLGKIGGGDVRPDRPAGWRVALRGWKRFEDYAGFAEYLRAASSRKRARPKKPDD